MKKAAFTLVIILVFSNFISGQRNQSHEILIQDVFGTRSNENISNRIITNHDKQNASLEDNVNRKKINYTELYPSVIENRLANIRSSAQITYREEFIFNQDSTYVPDIVCLDETHFVIVYPDTTQHRKGIVLAGTIFPDTIVFGNKVEFHNSAVHNFIRVDALTPTRFVISYIAGRPYNKGYAIVGDISGNEITLGPKCIFNLNHMSSWISLSSMNSDRIAITFTENDNSNINFSTVIGNIVNDTIIFSNEFPIQPEFSDNNIVLSIDSTHFVVIFTNQGRIKAVIGTYFENNITYSNTYEFTDTNDAEWLDATYLGNSKIAIAYVDLQNDLSQNAVIATINGDYITFGDDYIFSPPNPTGYPLTLRPKIEALDTSNFIIAFVDEHNNSHGSCVLGSLVSDSIDFSNTYAFAHLTHWYSVISKINANHFILAYINSYIHPHGKVIIGTLAIECSIVDIQICASDLTFPVITKHVDGIIEFLLEIDYDTSKLFYEGYTDPHSQLNNGTLNVIEDSSKITISWTSNEALSIVNDTLLKLQFSPIDTMNISNDRLSWNESSSYFVDVDSLDVTSIYDNGTYYLYPYVDSAGLIYGSDSVYYGSLDEEFQTSTIPNATTYIWCLDPDSSGIITGNDTSVLISFAENYIGIATLSVLGSNNCGDGIPSYKTINVVDNFVGIKENNCDLQVQIWPNPSSGKFSISVAGIKNNINFSIYNADLKLIHQEIIQAKSELTYLSYDIGKYSPGIYIVNLRNENLNLTRKIVYVK